MEEAIVPGPPTTEVLQEWAVIDADPALVYSTRRAGKPITIFKRGLLRLLRQYTRQIESQQTRFNLALVEHFEELERRVVRLERERRE